MKKKRFVEKMLQEKCAFIGCPSTCGLSFSFHIVTRITTGAFRHFLENTFSRARAFFHCWACLTYFPSPDCHWIYSMRIKSFHKMEFTYWFGPSHVFVSSFLSFSPLSSLSLSRSTSIFLFISSQRYRIFPSPPTLHSSSASCIHQAVFSS